MADIPFSDISEKGSGFQTDGIVYESIASGQTGELISVPEVTGKVYRIFVLAGAGGGQSGISLITDGVTIESEKTLQSSLSAAADSQFLVYRNYANTTSTTNQVKIYDVVECSSFSVEKNAGNTSQVLNLSYEIGEYR